MGRRRRAGAPRFSRRRLALVFVAFALLTTAHECQDDQGNSIAHQHCWDGSEAAPGGCPPQPTPEPEPEPECPAGFWFFWGGCITQCPDGTHIVLGESCPDPEPPPPPIEVEVTQADCDAIPATIHGQPHQTFPFDGDGSGTAETCAYPGDASHTHNAPPTTHPHTYYPFNRPGGACSHTHAENVSLDGSGNPVVSGHTHWEAGSCQRQTEPVRPPAQRPSPFPPADIGSPTSRAERPPSRDIDGDGTDDLCGSGLNLDFQLPGQQYRACWEGPTDEDIRNHWNLWYVEELVNGSWVTTSWPTSACGPRVAENQNCGHTVRPSTFFWREHYETHGDQVTYVRWWRFRQFECYPVEPGEHKHSPQTCERDHQTVPDCVTGLADGQTQSFTTHDSNGNNVTVEVVDCDDPPCEPDPGEHAHGSICEADHPAVPACVAGQPDGQTQQFTTHNSEGQNLLVDVPDCEDPPCEPDPGEHAHGPVCEADHPPAPGCVPGLPDSQTARYTAHDSSEANISVLVVGCVTTSNRCVPRTGEHAHGSVCEADHPPAPSCVAGLADNQHRLYTTHNAAGHNTVVPVPGCVPTTPPVIAPVTPPEEDEDDPVCDSNWGAGQLAVLASRVRIESYVGAGDEPPTPEVPGGSAFSHVASDRQGGQRRPAWMWLALNGSLLRRGTLDVDDRRDGHECYWEATGVGVQLRELIPAGGGGAEMRTLAAQGRVGAASAITAALGLWDSWTPDEQADWAAVFAPAQRPAAVWCDDDHLPVQRPFGDREASEQARRTACRWEAPRAGIWEWAIWVDYLSDQNDTARKQLGTDVTWFKAIVDLDRDQVTIW